MAVAAPEAGISELIRSWIRPLPGPEEAKQRSSSAGLPLPAVYLGPEAPGEYPFTRGRTPLLYHDELWVMGMYSGYATPAETNARFRRLLDAGQTGLALALDLPTQMGLDSDHPLAKGEIGKVGVPLDTVDDLLGVLDGLPLDRVRQMRTSANAIGPIFTALMLVALEEQGVDPTTFRLLLQNDPLKEFSVRGTYIFPPRPSVRFAVDAVEYFSTELPHWEPIEFCGYHFRDAGGTAVHELAICMADGIEYLDEAVRRSVDVEWLAPMIYLLLSAGVDVFEETAKLRASRRLWARLLHERYGVSKDAAAINIFSYTLGGQLAAQEPLNNVIRVAYQALAAALGGVQTLATSSYDEALGLPSPEASHLALRTQQVLAYEAGATKVVDPLAGSYYVEDLTDRFEGEALAYLLRIAEQGGAVAAIESGFIAQEVAQSAYTYQREVDAGERPVVGVSIFPAKAEEIVEAFTIPDEVQHDQLDRLAAAKERRSESETSRALAKVTGAAADERNTIPALVTAARARATLGEMVDALATVFGRYSPGQVRF